MVRDIIQEGDPILRKRQPYIYDEAKIQQILQDLWDTLKDSRAVGFAANQIGEPYKICIVTPNIVLINPEILSQKGRFYSQEGCMSIPGYLAMIPRSVKIKVRVDMPRRTVVLSGFQSAVAQHEIDHTEGFLLRDYCEETNGKKSGILLSDNNQAMTSYTYFQK